MASTFYSNYDNTYRLVLVITPGVGNPATNQTPITWALYLYHNTKDFSGTVSEGYLNLDGVRRWTSPSTMNTLPYASDYNIPLANGSFIATHASDGTKTIAIYAAYSANSGGWGPVGLLINTSLTLTTIPRYAAISSFSATINDLSATLSWSADKTISQWRYSSDNGATYSSWVTVNAASGSVAIGVTPGSSYNFKIQVKASDSGLDTTSSTVAKTATKTPSIINNLAPNPQTVGSVMAWGITEYYSAYTHVLSYAFGTASGYLNGSTAFTALTGSWTVPIDLASQFPNATSGSGTVTLKTYYGALLIGTTSIPFTLKTENTTTFQPTLSITSINLIDGLDGVYVKGKSKVNVVSSAAGEYGATISQHKVVIDGVTLYGSNVTSGLITNIGTRNITVTATDTRGYSVSLPGTFYVYDYFSPSITTFTAARSPVKVGTDLAVAVNFSIAPVNDKNEKYYAILYRVVGETTWTELFSSSAYYTRNTTHSFAGILNTALSYEVKLEIRDSYNTSSTPITLTKPIGTVFKLMNMNAAGDGIGFGKYAERPGFDFATAPMVNGVPLGGSPIADILLAVYPVGAIYTSVVATSPATLFGGTWAAFAAGRVLVGLDSGDSNFNTVEETGGSKTHTLTTAELAAHSHATTATSNSTGAHTHTWSATSSSDSHTHTVSGTAATATLSGTFQVRSGQYTNYNIAGGGTGIVSVATQSGGAWGNSVATSTTDMAPDTVTVNASHSHSVSGTAAADTHAHTVSGTTVSNGAHAHTITVSNPNTGSGAAHNNLQPYITVYMWKRTA